MKVKIAQKGDKILKETAKEISLEDLGSVRVQNILKKMKKAIGENEEAVAIAAPQIGESLRIFVISEYIFAPKNEEKKKNDFGYIVFVNPKIIKISREKKILTEGCMSVKNIYGAVWRANKIKVEAYDENGKKFIKSGAGLFAQIIQHETDHLDGLLFTDKAIIVKKYESKDIARP